MKRAREETDSPQEGKDCLIVSKYTLLCHPLPHSNSYRHPIKNQLAKRIRTSMCSRLLPATLLTPQLITMLRHKHNLTLKQGIQMYLKMYHHRRRHVAQLSQETLISLSRYIFSMCSTLTVIQLLPNGCNYLLTISLFLHTTKLGVNSSITPLCAV